MPKKKKKASASLEEKRKVLKEVAKATKNEEVEKKKVISKYTVDQLLEKAEDCLDRFEYEVAQKFYQRALEMEPDNVHALESVGTLLLESGNTEAAKQCFGRAVEVSPDEGHAKYMYLGQLFEGAQAVECFQKGIELMVKEKEKQQAEEVAASCRGAGENGVSEKDVSSAYCAIAEIYMTDSCFEEQAEDKCQENVNKAIEVDPDNPEAYQLKASFLLSKDDKNSAREAIKKSVSLWLPKLKAIDKGDIPDEEFDPVETTSVSYECRISAAKILIEVEEYETATEILEFLLDEDDEVPQVWYTLGWANFLQGEDYKGNARYYLNKAKKVCHKVKSQDEELMKHIDEMLEDLGPGEGDNEDEEENEVTNGDADEEPESSDEEPMEH